MNMDGNGKIFIMILRLNFDEVIISAKERMRYMLWNNFDADTILKDIMDEQDFEISGMAQEIFNIYHKSSDKQAVKEMFFEFTGMEFDQYLMKCSKEITRK